MPFVRFNLSDKQFLDNYNEGDYFKIEEIKINFTPINENSPYIELTSDNQRLMFLYTRRWNNLLKQKPIELPKKLIRTCLNGYLVQDKDSVSDSTDLLEKATELSPSNDEITDLIFASKICKHTKSNTIVLAKNKQLYASGTGQTSRVDALNQAINKAKSFGFDLKGSVMASDAFFPFPDCVEIADNAGVKAVIQPGGSIKDQLSIDYCNENNIAMVFTNTRHFKH